MGDIIVINDDSKESLHAAKYAFNLACVYNKNIVLANVISSKPTVLESLARAKPVPSGFQVMLADEEGAENLADHLNCLKSGSGFTPGIKTLDATGYGERELISYVNIQKTWMIVRGAANDSAILRITLRLNMQTVLNRVQCPILMVPESAEPAALERLVYLADLRYAQIPVINYLAKLHNANESVILAHICANGLPELDKSYASDLFSNGLSRNVVGGNLFFTQLKKKHFPEVIDTAIHGLQGDMLICSNHSYHFEQLFGSTFNNTIPVYVPVPILVFPC